MLKARRMELKGCFCLDLLLISFSFDTCFFVKDDDVHFLFWWGCFMLHLWSLYLELDDSSYILVVANSSSSSLVELFKWIIQIQ
jgi:hypothetical protein